MFPLFYVSSGQGSERFYSADMIKTRKEGRYHASGQISESIKTDQETYSCQ